MSKRPKNWLKGVLSVQTETDTEQKSETEPRVHNKEASNLVEGDVEKNIDGTQYEVLFPREDMDKVTLDMVVSVENLIKNRRLVLLNNEGLKDQLHNANETISRLKTEATRLEQVIDKKEQEYVRLEEKLTSKQMSYDQLLEDYKNYQYASNNEFEDIKNQLEKEINKYKRLDEEFTDYKYKNVQIIKDLKEKIRDLEAENQKVTEQYQKAVNDKNLLLETFNDFSERMSFSLSQKNQTGKPVQETASE